MNKQKIVNETAEFARNFLEKAEGSHDWWHTFRVWEMAKRIGKEEQVDQFVIEMAALLHDLADYKLNDGSDEKGMKFVKDYLNNLVGISLKEIEHIVEIIDNLSFRKTFDGKRVQILEGQVVQDADRLDALGAIGIARVFDYGGARGRKIYNPAEKISKYKSSKKYRQSETSAVNHFHEKILLLKELMNTETAKKIAKHRHKFIEDYLKEFSAEWEGNS